MTKKDAKFIAAVKAMEKATRGLCAYAVINPHDPENNGRFVTRNGPRCRAVGWLPGKTKSEACRHSGSAKGYGFDKATAAMGGATFYNLKTGQMDALKDEGSSSRAQLEAAGYIVIQTV